MANYAMNDERENTYDGGVYYLKPITKKDDTPHFSVKTRQDNKYVELEKKPISTSGNLKGIEFGSYEWEGKTIKTFKVSLDKETKEEGNQLSIISMSFTNTSRSILNCILNHNGPIDTLSITLAKNKAGYNGAYTSINGHKGNWKISSDEMKKLIDVETTKKGLKITDYDKLDQFFEDEMMKHMATILPGSRIVNDDESGGFEPDPDLDDLFDE